jgi:hypothetical protein
MKKSHALWITRAAVLTALLVGAQVVTAPFQITLLTGAIVNLILVISVLTSGIYTGLAVGFLSPYFAALVGIGAIWPIVPFVSLANMAFVMIWHCGDKLHFSSKIVKRVISCAVAALCKFALLYLGVVRLAIPHILDVPEPVANVLTVAFSINQLFTALIGGTLAILALPAIEKAISLRKKE